MAIGTIIGKPVKGDKDRVKLIGFILVGILVGYYISKVPGALIGGLIGYLACIYTK